MQRLEVSGAVRPIYGSLGVKRLREFVIGTEAARIKISSENMSSISYNYRTH